MSNLDYNDCESLEEFKEDKILFDIDDCQHE